MLAPDSKISSSDLPGVAADVYARVRERAPRVHCITNAVAQNFTANVLLAAGAVPSMTIAPVEVSEFIARADALLVNLGTFDAERRVAAEIAVAKAVEHGRPWVLDPVFVDRSPARSEFARSLVAMRPQAIRLNRAEFAALAGCDLDGAALAQFAEACGAVIGLTGETDVVFGADRLVCLANGHPLMAKVTAVGCAETAFVGACLAVESDAWTAVAAGLLIFGIAGQIAAETAKGPGSLAVGILDTLHGLDRATLIDRARVV